MARIKGTQLVGVVTALRASREHIVRSAVPARLQRYLDERILASSWYPEEDFRDLTIMLGHLMARGVKGNVWRKMGMVGAERDYQGLYAAFIRKGDPERTLRLFPEGWKQYRDTGKLEIEELRAGFARVALSDYPVMCTQMAEVNAGYFETALRLAGAQSIVVEVLRWDSTSAGWQLSWQ